MKQPILKSLLLFLFAIFSINFVYADQLSSHKNEKNYIVRVTSKDQVPVKFSGSIMIFDEKGSILGQIVNQTTPYEFPVKINFLGLMLQSNQTGNNSEIKVSILEMENGKEQVITSGEGHSIFAFNNEGGDISRFVIAK